MINYISLSPILLLIMIIALVYVKKSHIILYIHDTLRQYQDQNISISVNQIAILDKEIKHLQKNKERLNFKIDKIQDREKHIMHHQTQQIQTIDRQLLLQFKILLLQKEKRLIKLKIAKFLDNIGKNNIIN